MPLWLLVKAIKVTNGNIKVINVSVKVTDGNIKVINISVKVTEGHVAHWFYSAQCLGHTSPTILTHPH